MLPFRVLRADPEIDFLAFSLPDAIASSLSRFGSVVVRSSATAARFGGELPDLKALAVEAGVDRVVMGTLMSSGGQLQAIAQLIEAPGGTLLTSHTVLSSLGDLFRLQGDIARRVVEALSLMLTGGGVSLTPDAPHNAQAYGLYLRANELAREYEQLPQARELYQRCVDLDPNFARDAFRRALELSPRLAIAHKYLANLEADTGHATNALVRLLGAVERHGNDAELFAGLVHACRYCGLFEQSIAAHHEARRLDPNVPTSLEQTLLMTGDLERLLAAGTSRDVHCSTCNEVRASPPSSTGRTSCWRGSNAGLRTCTRARTAAASGREWLLRRADAREPSAIRAAAGRAGVSRSADGFHRRTARSAGGVSKRRRRAVARLGTNLGIDLAGPFEAALPSFVQHLSVPEDRLARRRSSCSSHTRSACDASRARVELRMFSGQRSRARRPARCSDSHETGWRGRTSPSPERASRSSVRTRRS
ncbi:MAG: hypothetical protein HOP12_01635 [Candidatus Eisenbacteria bacterium]|uniref:Tetratricopeptide repeat protein n=1 Tax=Eiseniibacteriota bacterium TaxID=2212470 RepID=A0A849SN46_UNCEI|nr:hypothetical protein [Candidatus Eisenbacteria bacterium]